jgi:CBS domain-containing protein
MGQFFEIRCHALVRQNCSSSLVSSDCLAIRCSSSLSSLSFWAPNKRLRWHNEGRLAHLAISEAMVTHLVKLPPEATLEDAVEALLRTLQHEFPVVDSEDRILGILTRDRLIAALKQKGPTAAVADVMQRDLPTVRPDNPFDKAFQLMQESMFPALPVVDRFGTCRGLITPENVGELMMVSTLLPKTGRPAWRSSPRKLSFP